MTDNMVFVLGAGFTRAFVPSAPLLVDDYGLQDLAVRFAGFPQANAILSDAMSQSPARVDLEKLMTRLIGMPYDRQDGRHELALLESALRRVLLSRLQSAKTAGVDRDGLAGFARFVLETSSSIITFNYDDVIDEALSGVNPVLGGLPQGPYWHPDGGYGFFCRPSTVCVNDESVFMDRPKSSLLKLHGSVNWRSRLGVNAGLGPTELLHHEAWLPQQVSFHMQYDDRDIEAHLEPEPFIVPPVLVKTELTQHPVLRVVWTAARDRLREANRVVFLGYSLPQTDLAARTLFQESLRDDYSRIEVVDYSATRAPDVELMRTYRSLFGHLDDAQFDFGGAAGRIDREFSVEPKPAGLAERPRNHDGQ